MNLADIKDVKALLSSEGFVFKKSLGQNFIVDETVCPAMADSCCDQNTGVIEIGPGAGVLTYELGKRAKKVVAIEIDERLKPVLAKTVGEFKNVEVIFGDVLKLDLNKIIEEKFTDCEKIAVCANLPYYITSPIIISLLESKLNIASITAMVQKEAALRLCARLGERAAGAVTAAVEYYSEAEILFDVPRDCFLPVPNVDSAVIRLNIRKEPPVILGDEKLFFDIINAGFNQRRKTLSNSLSNRLKIDKQTANDYLAKASIKPSARAEELNIEQFAALCKAVNDYN